MIPVPGYVVFGASRGLGEVFVRQLRARNLSVSVLLRSRLKAEPLSALGVHCLIGDATDPSAVADTLAALPKDTTVISTLGSFQSDRPVDFEGHRLIIDCMERLSLKSILLVTSWGCGESWKWLTPRVREIIGPSVRLKSLAESWLMSSTLDYRILRPVGLTDGEATGRLILSQNEEVHGWVRREDVAHMGLSLLADPSTRGGVYACHDPSLVKS